MDSDAEMSTWTIRNLRDRVAALEKYEVRVTELEGYLNIRNADLETSLAHVAELENTLVVYVDDRDDLARRVDAEREESKARVTELEEENTKLMEQNLTLMARVTFLEKRMAEKIGHDVV